eukprot:6190439-Pleurochrysis_carterae.AAC.1
MNSSLCVRASVGTRAGREGGVDGGGASDTTDVIAVLGDRARLTRRVSDNAAQSGSGRFPPRKCVRMASHGEDPSYDTAGVERRLAHHLRERST